jgi:arginyl-tRNA synthetase
VGRVHATTLLYVVGAPQSQHFEMVFAVARQAGWLPDTVEAHHIIFGSVLGTDRKMLKSRQGDSVKLVELLDEAVERAAQAISERVGDIDDGAKVRLAHEVGIGAVKYADLSTERQRDYVFDLDRMVAFEGDTGPYLQYAHARIRSIFRRGSLSAPEDVAVSVTQPAERALAIALCEYAPTLVEVLSISAPSKLCAYLYSLAATFTTFYEQCPVLRAEDDELRASRLFLCETTARVLAQGLSLLGIAAPEQM